MFNFQNELETHLPFLPGCDRAAVTVTGTVVIKLSERYGQKTSSNFAIQLLSHGTPRLAPPSPGPSRAQPLPSQMYNSVTDESLTRDLVSLGHGENLQLEHH